MITAGDDGKELVDPRYLEFCPEGTLYYDKPRGRPGYEEFASVAPVPEMISIESGLSLLICNFTVA
ncbi:hypothetical protein [Amycolatopsis sp. WAC 04169]|uniref:hypothetical protein n=1 Tax=Amycolatopsis sp. WAC 04169 TaxID=2203197 RepID=UPI000F7A89AC|nr:hypothetical protein [Amycolatopsis sp. WAC 04169]